MQGWDIYLKFREHHQEEKQPNDCQQAQGLKRSIILVLPGKMEGIWAETKQRLHY